MFQVSEIQCEWHLVTNMKVYIMTGCLFRENKAITSAFSFKITLWNTRCSKGHINRFYVLLFKIDTLFMNKCASIFCYHDILGFSSKKTIIFMTDKLYFTSNNRILLSVRRQRKELLGPCFKQLSVCTQACQLLIIANSGFVPENPLLEQ